MTSSGCADRVTGVFQRTHVDPGHGDHDRAIGHLRQRGGRVPGADVGDLAHGVELGLLQVTHVFHAVLLQERRGVQNERRPAVGQNRRPSHEGRQPAGGIERLDHDILLSQERIDHQGGAPLTDLEDDGRLPGGGYCRCRADTRSRRWTVGMT